MSYNATYKTQIRETIFEDTSDWMPIQHVPEWMRLDRVKLPKGGANRYTSKSDTVKQDYTLGKIAVLMGVHRDTLSRWAKILKVGYYDPVPNRWRFSEAHYRKLQEYDRARKEDEDERLSSVEGNKEAELRAIQDKIDALVKKMEGVMK